MTTYLSISEDNIAKVLGDFLTAILPGVSIIRGQVNRVAEPSTANFVVMTPIGQQRLSTNVDALGDVAFIGSIAGTTLTVTQMLNGTIAVGQAIRGDGISPLTAIDALGSGHGGIGTYTVSPTQTAASTTIQAGTVGKAQDTQITVQLDVHGPNAGNNSQIISTLFRDEYAVDQFAASGYAMAPLYVSDPKQMPFINAEQQYEDRWTIDAVLEAIPVVTVAQDFAGAATVSLVDVDVVYAP